MLTLYGPYREPVKQAFLTIAQVSDDNGTGFNFVEAEEPAFWQGAEEGWNRRRRGGLPPGGSGGLPPGRSRWPPEEPASSGAGRRGRCGGSGAGRRGRRGGLPPGGSRWLQTSRCECVRKQPLGRTYERVV